MTKPILSVLMTAYNREKFIAEAIESALASIFNNFELIILDDCSTDNTVQIIEDFVKKDERIKFYNNTSNLGQFATRNKIVTYATGEYIMWLDSDDKTYPFSFDYCLGEMLLNAEADVGMLCRIENLCGKILNPSQSINHHFFVNQFLFIGPGGTIMKKSFFEKIGGYPDKYGPPNDMYFNLKAATYGNIKCLCKEFLFYRTHEGQELNNPYSYLYNGYLYMKDALQELPMPISARQKMFLINKTKRRFFVNAFKYLYESKNFLKTYKAFKLAKFTFKDCLIAITQRKNLDIYVF
jgi:glycosyltransferase involved in cell wall biosynthesis